MFDVLTFLDQEFFDDGGLTRQRTGSNDNRSVFWLNAAKTGNAANRCGTGR